MDRPVGRCAEVSGDNPYTAVRRDEYATLGDAYRLCRQDPEAFAAGAQYALDKLNSHSGPIQDTGVLGDYLRSWSAEILTRALNGEPQ